jgi:hypothetical protein
LDDVIGPPAVKVVENLGVIQFHTAGDTGVGDDSAQTMVSDAMARDYDVDHPEKSPAFFFHLGDVTQLMQII